MNNDFLPINEENTGTENNQLFMVPMVQKIKQSSVKAEQEIPLRLEIM